MEIITKALAQGRHTLTEFESKLILADYGIPITRETLVFTKDEMLKAAEEIGYPLVLKGCSPNISHKTEKGVVRVDIRDAAEAEKAYDEITSTMQESGAGILVQEMISGRREVMAGLTRDPQFGPCVMYGLGGIFTEILKDVCFRLAPLTANDAADMLSDIKGCRILDAVRGMEPVDRAVMADILIKVGRIGTENPSVKEIDINPIIISKGKPIAVDALIIIGEPEK